MSFKKRCVFAHFAPLRLKFMRLRFSYKREGAKYAKTQRFLF